jgi:hypothetical protein
VILLTHRFAGRLICSTVERRTGRRSILRSIFDARAEEIEALGAPLENTRESWGEGAVAAVLESVSFGAAGRGRQDGIKTIQSLNLRLLIEAKHGAC